MVQVLVISLLVITTIYLLINGVFIRVLGMERMAASDAVGVDLMRVTLGEPGVFLIGVLVALAALTSVNATIFTGARTNYALGRDFKAFRWLGKCPDKTSSQITALWEPAFVDLVLSGLGWMTR